MNAEEHEVMTGPHERLWSAVRRYRWRPADARAWVVLCPLKELLETIGIEAELALDVDVSIQLPELFALIERHAREGTGAVEE